MKVLSPGDERMSHEHGHSKQQLGEGGQEEDTGRIDAEQPRRDCCGGGLVPPSLHLPILQRRCRWWPWAIAIIVPPKDDVDPSSFQFVPTP
jgi:hypothetical protein